MYLIGALSRGAGALFPPYLWDGGGFRFAAAALGYDGFLASLGWFGSVGLAWAPH